MHFILCKLSLSASYIVRIERISIRCPIHCKLDTICCNKRDCTSINLTYSSYVLLCPGPRWYIIFSMALCDGVTITHTYTHKESIWIYICRERFDSFLMQRSFIFPPIGDNNRKDFYHKFDRESVVIFILDLFSFIFSEEKKRKE